MMANRNGGLARSGKAAAGAAHHQATLAGDRVVRTPDSFQNVGAAYEAGDELRLRPLIDVFRRSGLFDAAIVHDNDHVGRGHRLRLVVRHIDGRIAEFVMQPADLEPHFFAEIGVQVG